MSAAEEGPPEPEETVTAVGRRRVHVPDALARGVLTLLLLGLIAWVLLDNIGNLEDVGAALAASRSRRASCSWCCCWWCRS